MMILADYAARQRFIHEHQQNFSVIAPAGVGKTTAITQRVASIVQKKSIPLDKLVVVTYTQKAAEELRQRSFLEIQELNENLVKCDQIFFGTIHSFADTLLRKYGHLIGVSPDFEVEKNEKKLWDDFWENSNETIDFPDKISSFLDPKDIHRLIANHYWETISASHKAKASSYINCDALLAFPHKSNVNILQFQNNLRVWLQNKALPFPKINTTAKEFLALYQEIIAPIEDLCAIDCIDYFNCVAKKFEHFRVKNQRLTFVDLINFSTRLLQKHRDIVSEFSVILDEAQDTDPCQFEFLLKLAQSEEILPPGHFCMIGDPQQSIYNSRANVEFYQKSHDILTNNRSLEALHFSVTMRFGPPIAENINCIFPHLLNGQDGQVVFNELSSGINPAKISEKFPAWSVLKVNATQNEASYLSQIFKNKTPRNFDVTSWSEIAILCPRRAWLNEIQRAFRDRPGVPNVQNHSSQKTYKEFREFAWIHALITFFITPNNEFEFSGILREIFGISDASIAAFSQGNKSKNIADIAEQLNILRKLSETLSSFEIVCNLYETLELKARIIAIETAFQKKILDFILLGSVTCHSLLELKIFLQKNANEIYTEEGIQAEALQLYTFHKAKGLEWPAVIIPFINRKQNLAPKTFPDIVGKKIILNKRQYEEMHSPNAEGNNFERLLYVALTRQKRYTIFVDDGTSSQNNSITMTLEKTPENINFFNRLRLMPLSF